MSRLAGEEMQVRESNTFLELDGPASPVLRKSSSDSDLRYVTYTTRPKRVETCLDGRSGKPSDLWSDVTDETCFGSDDGNSTVCTESSGATTLMLKNLPSSYLRSDLQSLLDRTGSEGQYDFVHAPVDCFSGAALGYAFVNFVSEAAAEQAMKALQGFSRWNARSRKVLTVCWGEEQGLDCLIERYRNNRMMHSTVPDKYRPLMLQNGQPVPFPAPTKRVLKPRCLPSVTSLRR